MTKTKSRYVWRSISQYVVVSSPLWDLWLPVLRLLFESCCPVSVGRPLWREVGSCHLPFSVCSNLSVCTSRIYVSCVLQFSIEYTIHTKILSVPARYSRFPLRSTFRKTSSHVKGHETETRFVIDVMTCQILFAWLWLFRVWNMTTTPERFLRCYYFHM
jgi:hypothetical protein